MISGGRLVVGLGMYRYIIEGEELVLGEKRSAEVGK